ncbi:MAG: glycosyltransferase family 4 protein [Cyanobacteria bacterium REEB67]|nr:glycosyltransferase family 4 protein [Cyanobacteria bacterium REEB67]
MRIAQVAPLAESVPPQGYGGSELVVSLLTEELIKRGHQVTLFASADSRTSAKLEPCAPQGLRASSIPPTRWTAYDQKMLLKLEARASEFDIIHNHLGYAGLPLLRFIDCPTVSTIHNPVRDYCADVYLACKEMPIVAISDAYKRLNYPDDLNYVATVHNGIDISGFDYQESATGNYLLFIGRLCDDKGTAEAIQIARAVNMPIILAGKVDANDQAYFDKNVKPLLSEPGVTYIGEISGDEKNRLYGAATATLCPIKFEEPFGLVFAESLACGTPVLALKRGAAPEVISDGETGVVDYSVEALIKRFDEIARISREKCRRRAADLFSKERMAESYEQVYKNMVDRAALQKRPLASVRNK